jgi:hypothetical protein
MDIGAVVLGALSSCRSVKHELVINFPAIRRRASSRSLQSPGKRRLKMLTMNKVVLTKEEQQTAGG